MVTPPNHSTRANIDEIDRAISFICEPGQVYEVRAFPRGTASGYFDDFSKLAQAAASLSGRAPAVYITANPVLPELLARSANRVKGWAKTTTSDAQILRRRWLLLDLDPVRPADISSTEEEHQQALSRAIEIRSWLQLNGWPDPIFADSGNGAHLLYRVNLPNDVDATNLLMNCLNALSFRFDCEAVKVDTGNFNAARIWKLYGTLAAKGDSIPDRPHRLARILEAPAICETVASPLLQTLAAKVPQRPPAPTHGPYRGKGEPFDLEKWISGHAIPIHHQGDWGGGHKWVLAQCLWNPDHSDKSAFILRFSDGAIAAGCHHNACQGKGWPELREAIEPGYAESREHRRYSYDSKGHRLVYAPTIEVPL